MVLATVFSPNSYSYCCFQHKFCTNCAEHSRNMSTYPHTPYIQERRRALFPAQDESDSDLGPMSPLSSDINDSETESVSDDYYFKSLRANSTSDYVILGNIKGALDTSATSDDENDTQTLHLSPFSQLLTSPIISDDQTIVPDTPVKGSPTQTLKTPHDTAITQTSLPKLVRKSVLETAMNKAGNKRLSSPINSPESKRLKTDNKGSKVRTALFPEPEAVPTKLFYSKTETNKNELKCFDYDLQDDKPKRKKQTQYLCNRRARGKNRFGQINAGVRHKIKKPKHKKPTKTSLLRAALRIIEDSPLNEFLKDLGDLHTKQITPIAQESTKKLPEVENRRRDPSPEPDPNKKFFKSSRHRGVVTVNGNIKLEVDGKNVTLLQKNNKVKKTKTDICFEDSDFNDDNDVDKSLISNVLNILEEEKENLPTPIVLKAHTSVKASENSILLHNTSQKRTHSEILSPISQMCDTTSGLALNSPKKARNLNTVLENMCAYSSTDSANVFSKFSSLPNMEQKKMFPIFEKNYRPPKSAEKSDRQPVSQAKRWKALPADQMLLDAGQKRFGPTQCVECGIIYHMGDPSEELMHLKYHGSASALKFHVSIFCYCTLGF